MHIKTAITLFVLCFSTHLLANYVVCLNQEQIDEAMTLLKYQQDIYYSQQATQIEEYERIAIDTFYSIESEECKAIYLEGVYTSGNRKHQRFEQELDLAYTWIQKDEIGVNLAFQIHIPVVYAPVDPFYWKNLKPLYKDAGRSQYKEAYALVDSIRLQLGLSSNFNIYNSSGQKVVPDSVNYDFNLSRSELVIHQYFGEQEEKRFIVNLKQCFDISFKEFGGQKSLYIHGANYKQFYKNNDQVSSLPFLYLRVNINSKVDTEIIKQFERLIDLLQHYHF
ncbi:hypothetical protein SAMN05216474_0847 [Lishizhenia tianjinensis]|uniref:Uncharacterized protein n=1 Tax=Lishizhenia tianjinensis TaxID=477690 RepID=A0A1I6YEX3_9FLAO|nr:hypothetical protein [Lishizhenia tianjinensis]SFT48891.1 hypothetical protein SAMN05216474_0847 [Lishizhenia tianjinensis]